MSFQTSETASQSIGTATGPGSVATGRRWSKPGTPVWSTQKARTPCSASSRSSPGRYAHSGSQKPPRQSPKRSRWAAVPVATCRRTPASVAIRGSSAWVAAEVQSSTPLERAEGPHEVAAVPLEALLRARVVAGRAAHLGGQLALARGVQPGGVLRVDRRAHVAQEAEVAIAGVPLHRVELVAEHRREPERDRHAVDQLEQRQVDARDGLPQPLLAERPRAEALDVRHVRVEHDRQRARPRLRRAAHAGTGLGQRPAFHGTTRQAVEHGRSDQDRRHRHHRQHRHGVESGVGRDHGEQRAGALVHEGTAPTPKTAITGRMIAVSVPWKWSAPNTTPSMRAASQTRIRVRSAR